jgi:hypothetical protein
MASFFVSLRWAITGYYLIIHLREVLEKLP